MKEDLFRRLDEAIKITSKNYNNQNMGNRIFRMVREYNLSVLSRYLKSPDGEAIANQPARSLVEEASPTKEDLFDYVLYTLGAIILDNIDIHEKQVVEDGFNYHDGYVKRFPSMFDTRLDARDTFRSKDSTLYDACMEIGGYLKENNDLQPMQELRADEDKQEYVSKHHAIINPIRKVADEDRDNRNPRVVNAENVVSAVDRMLNTPGVPQELVDLLTVTKSNMINYVSSQLDEAKRKKETELPRIVR
jgi:hypothetical protein